MNGGGCRPLFIETFELVAVEILAGLSKISQRKLEGKKAIAVRKHDGCCSVEGITFQRLQAVYLAIEIGKMGKQERGLNAGFFAGQVSPVGVKSIDAIEAAKIHAPIAGSEE